MAPFVAGITKTIPELAPKDTYRMLELLETYYDGVMEQKFFKDLQEKDGVMLILDSATQHIVGFSTFMIIDLDVGERVVKGFFSGDTIMKKEYRKSTALGVEIGKNFIEAIERFKEYSVYWTLISKGCRTYCLLPLFFYDFYPRYDAKTPGDIQAIIHALGRKKYPDYYNSSTGIIEYPEGVETEIFKTASEEITERRLLDPHIRFFLNRNPGYVTGNELVCVAKVSVHNFTPVFVRMLRMGGVLYGA